MFASNFNCVTGQMEWQVTGKDIEQQDTDLSEEFSRSQYGDMLHDTERNKKYELGLKWAISTLSSKGVEPRVLDIGSGTGLLSMMASRNGARNITAIEVLKPMVKILKNVVKVNGHEDSINVISKHSTDVTVGPGGDMKQRANILVTEVFDSELIGEGAVPTFRHAHEELLEDEALVIPYEGTVYVQLLQSNFLRHSHSLDPNQVDIDVIIPDGWGHCSGSASLWDIHLEQVIAAYDVIPLSEPHVVAKFNFSDPSLPVYREYDPVSILVNDSGNCSALAVWWDITLAPGVELSMSPWQQDLQWRDHWLPCVQVLPHPLCLKEGNSLRVQVVSDEYTMWAEVLDKNKCVATCASCPACTCGVHMAWSRSRLRMLNNCQRNTQLQLALDKVISKGVTSVLCVSDGSLLPLMCSQKHSTLTKIFTVETNQHSSKSFQELVQATPTPVPIQVLEKPVSNLSLEDIGHTPLQALVAEPFFITSTLPWHNLYYWYARTSLNQFLAPGAVVMPCKAILKAIAVTCKDLHLLKADVGTVEGLDITAYDKAVANARTGSRAESLDPEDYALWEYPCYPLSDVQSLMTFDLSQIVPANDLLQTNGSFPLADHTHLCHGIVVWMEYQLVEGDDNLLSEGLLEPPMKGSELVWSSDHNQGVCFFMDYEKTLIQYSVAFNTSNGEMKLKFL